MIIYFVCFVAKQLIQHFSMSGRSPSFFCCNSQFVCEPRPKVRVAGRIAVEIAPASF